MQVKYLNKKETIKIWKSLLLIKLDIYKWSSHVYRDSTTTCESLWTELVADLVKLDLLLPIQSKMWYSPFRRRKGKRLNIR